LKRHFGLNHHSLRGIQNFFGGWFALANVSDIANKSPGWMAWAFLWSENLAEHVKDFLGPVTKDMIAG